MFDLKDKKLVIKVQDLMLPDFRILYKKDKSRTKEDALELFLYIHIVSQLDPKAPYAKSDPTQVRRLAKSFIFKDSDYRFSSNKLIKDEKLLDLIIELYADTYTTPARALELSFDKKIYQFKKMIDDTVPEIVKSHKVGKGTDEDGDPIYTDVKFVTNSDMLRKTMVDLEHVIAAKNTMSQLAENENISAGKVRANQQKSYLEIKHVEQVDG